FDVTAISAPGRWTADLEAEGIRHIPWPHATRSWAPRADVVAFAALVRIVRRERFHVVHTHTPKPGVLGRVAGRLTGVPCVVNTVHGLYTTPEDRRRRRFPVLAIERVAARFSDLELYQSEEDFVWARRIRLVRPGRSVLLGNGVDLARFDPSRMSPERLSHLRSELGIPADALVAGTVGRMVAEKGYRELFEAAASVREAHPQFRLLVIGGEDPDKADALTPAEIDRARQTVVFTGWRQDMPALLALMDVFVLPSWREGVPRSAIE